MLCTSLRNNKFYVLQLINSNARIKATLMKQTHKKPNIPGAIQNIPGLCCHLYSSCGSAKLRCMVRLLWPASQCGKLHIDGWVLTVSTRVYMESCTWPVTIRQMKECASNFVPILGKVPRRHSQWFNKASGTKAWVVHRWFNGISGSRPVAHRLTSSNTHEEPQVAVFNSSSVRIDVGPFATFVRR